MKTTAVQNGDRPDRRRENFGAITRPLLITGIVLLSCGALSSRATACSCAMPGTSPCGAMMDSDAVIFAGKAVSAQPTGLDTRYRFEVLESFRGADSMGAVDVSADSASSCAISFDFGVEYLVYAFKTDRGLVIGSCSRTQQLRWAQHDIELLREARQGAVRPRLVGHVTVGEDNPRGAPIELSPQVGAVITVTRGTEIIKRISDERGAFSFLGLQPGRYHVSASVAREFELSQSTEDVTLDAGDRCHAEVVFMAVRTPVYGVVVHDDGTLAGAGVRVSAVPVDSPRGPSEDDSTVTEADGTWRLRRLTPGRYRIGVNLLTRPTAASPYMTTWHPDAKRAADAAIVEVGARSSTHVEIRVPAPVVETTIRGVVLDDAKQPVPRAEVFLLVDDDMWVWSSTHTDDRGRFALPALQGREYRIRATRLDFPVGRPTLRDRVSDLLEVLSNSQQEITLVVRERP